MAEAFFPYSKLNLIKGPIRAIAAKRADLVALPEWFDDVCLMETPYTIQGEFFDFGAATNPGSYSRGHTATELTIEQDKAAVDTEVTEVTRGIQMNVAEFSPEALAILEQSPGIETVAAAPNVGGGKAVPFGTFDELDKYCVVLVGRRSQSAGLVEESTLTRGRMLAVVLWNASITGDAQSTQFAKGALSSVDVTFAGYPDEEATPGEDLGTWWLEDAATLTS
jgi:hypothetical protein